MKKILPVNRRARDTVFGVIAVLLAAAFLVIGILLPRVLFTGGVWIDNTPEGLYSLSDAMVEECSFLDDLEGEDAITVIFCSDPDILMESAVTRVPYVMALRMANKFDKFRVRTVNVDKNPTAVAKYRSTSLASVTSENLIVTYGNSYRVTTYQSFWTQDGSAYWSYNGEYRLVTLMLSITAVHRPAAYFVTGHGETVFDNDPTSEGSLATATLRDLLTDLGMRSELLDLSTVDAVPDDCILLIVNDPQTDFADNGTPTSLDTASNLEKIDRYLVGRQGALAVAKSPEVVLPGLENLLAEWGFLFSDTVVKDPTHTLSEDGTRFTALYNTEEGSYGYDVYGEFASMGTAPKVVVRNTGYLDAKFSDGGFIHESGLESTTRHCSPFLYSPATSCAYAYDPVTSDYTALAGTAASRTLAAVTARVALDSYLGEYFYSYVFCAASGDFFGEETLAAGSFANYDVVSVMFQSISRVDEYASVNLGGLSLNSSTYGGKQLVSTALSETDTEVYAPDASEIVRINHAVSRGAKIAITVVVAILPLAAAAVGIVVRVRRKYR